MADEIPLPLSRNLFFTKQVNQTSIAELTEDIVRINDNDAYLEKLYELHGLEYTRSPIKIYIDSYGGQVYQCFGLLGVMENSDTEIHTYVTGAAMSCGFMILICGDKRFGYKYATPLYHQVSTGFYGKLQDMKEDLVETNRIQKIIEQITLNKTKISKVKLKEILEKKIDWFMSAEEALKLKVIDEIV